MSEQVVPNDRPPLRRYNPIGWVVVASILAVLGLLWFISRDLGGPAGDPIPNQLPDEADRYFYPNGISMVLPPTWQPLSSGVGIVPLSPGRYARRSKALLHVASRGQSDPADLARLRRTTFLGAEAFEGMEVVRRWSFDDPARSDYVLLFRHGSDWYEVRYSIAEERTILPEIMRQYIHTIRWEEPPPAFVPDVGKP